MLRAAKNTALLLPLCHPLPLHKVALDLPVAWSDDAFLPFDWGWFAFVGLEGGPRPTSFRALAESDASMVMYLMPLILMPLEMTCLGSLLSEKEAAMALRSSSETWRCRQLSALLRPLAAALSSLVV